MTKVWINQNVTFPANKLYSTNIIISSQIYIYSLTIFGNEEKKAVYICDGHRDFEIGCKNTKILRSY